MNELSRPEMINTLPSIPDHVNPYDEANVFGEVAGSLFLPRVQLFISKSDAVTMSKIEANHYGYVTSKDAIEDLGKEVDMLLVSWRPRALDTKDKANIRSSCDTNSETFKDIVRIAKSGIKNSGCQYGPEYLVWVKDKGFATLFMGGASTRNEAPKVHSYYTKKQAVTFKSKLLSNTEYKWFSPCVFACSTPFDGPPDPEKTLQVIEDFLHPVEKAGLEKVEEEVAQRDR